VFIIIKSTIKIENFNYLLLLNKITVVMAEELIGMITSMSTHDPEEAYKILVNSYNTEWETVSIDKFLSDAYSRYKIYKININLSMHPSLLNNIDKFIEMYDTSSSTKKKELFNLTKKIDKKFLKLLEE
jgi:hypothetical protein